MLGNSLKHTYYRDTFPHQPQRWTKVLENNAKLKTWGENASSFLGSQMRSAICDALGSDLVRHNHSLIKGTNVPYRNTCFQEWDNMKNETWTSRNVKEWGSSGEKRYADAHISVTHGSPKLTDVRNDIRDADPKDKVKSMDLWIHVFIVRVWVFNAEWWQRQTGCISGSKSTLFGYENSTWGDGRAKLGFLIYLTEAMCCRINSFSCFW